MDKENLQPTKPYHTLTVDETYEALNTNPAGLDEKDTRGRISVYGPNELKEEKGRSLFAKFLDQFKDIMIIILLIAAGISGFMGEITDTVIILAVVLINAVLGVMQESKAEKALAALKKMSAPFAKVKRNGDVKHIKASEIVPGDIVILEAGDYVPADLRLIESSNLKIEEASLTGESVPVEKSTGKIDKEDVVIGDRHNMAYAGSVVTYGRGSGIAVGTGINTEVGKIAGYLSARETEQTPLQQKLAELGKYLTIAILAVAVVIFIVGVVGGRPYLDMFLTAVSLAVAAIPEGLPAVVTIVLALGVQRMAKINTIVRKLPAVETLGSTQIICSDKTGTLTQNKMTVRQIYVDENIVDENEFKTDSRSSQILMQVLTLCNDSKLEHGSARVLGDPTETALVSFALDKGYNKNEMDEKHPRKNEIPFDSDRKLMTTLNLTEEGYRVLTKGAPDVLIERCSHVLAGDEVKPLTKEFISAFQKANSKMAGNALRVLAVAYKDIENYPEVLTTEETENGLTLVALVGMIDPPRPEVRDAVEVCKKAGIRPIMITGDHRDTAVAIAGELEILSSGDEVITGRELNAISEEEFENNVEKYSVYARVSPEHKVRIVKAWKKKGKTVAMTGDGVNDAPALKIADIGVGMGITGTDVAKGVSDMVLTDDNFATIVEAVKEGRTIYSNIRKVVQYLLSANTGEIITLFLATMFHWKILYPIHILWINLVTDTFPALALGVEKPDRDVMTEKPRPASQSVFSEGFGINIVYQGILEGITTLVTYYISLVNYGPDVAVTMAFATLGLIQLVHVFNVRTGNNSVATKGLFSNMYLIGAILLAGLLQIIVILMPQLNTIFKVQHLNLEQWVIVIIASFSIIPIVEVIKSIRNFIARKKQHKN